MENYEYALQVFTIHLANAELSGTTNSNKIVMELGPGGSLFSALLAKAFSFKGSLLLDVDDYTLLNIQAYRNMAHWLINGGYPCPNLDQCESIDKMQSMLECKFLTNGLASLRSLPSESVDFIFSHAVLEHIRRDQFEASFGELWRILKSGGVSTHVVDFQDHLDHSINHLRFSDRLWETDWFARSSRFYTNRLRLGEMVKMIENQGFIVEVLYKAAWTLLPLPRNRLHPRYRLMDDEDLLVFGATLRLRKQAR